MASNDENVHISDLRIAGSLTFLAGATDVCGLAKLHDVYVSFMSANTTMLEIWPLPLFAASSQALQ